MSYNSLRSVVCTPSTPRKPPIINETHDKDFSAGFSQLWSSGWLSDFTIVVDGSKEFQVHKAVLSIHSPVFTAMFKNDMKEHLKIPNFTAEAVDQFLAFMYTGRLKDESQIMDIFALAALFNVSKLKSMCEEIIKSNVDTANVYGIMSLGDLYSSMILKEAAFKVIKQMFPGKNLPDELLQNPERLKKLITARDVRDKKFQAAKKICEDADMEFEDVCHNINVTNDLEGEVYGDSSDSSDSIILF